MSQRTAKRLIAGGDIESILIGRLRRVRPAAVEAYLDRIAIDRHPTPLRPVATADDPLQRTSRSPHRRARRPAEVA